MDAFAVAEYVGEALDLFGVVVILVGISISTVMFVRDYIVHDKDGAELYKSYRTNLARAILLGLEILVAGDIIRSIVGRPSFTSVGVLAILVLIRSFLSITFDMELKGRWPWKARQ